MIYDQFIGCGKISLSLSEYGIFGHFSKDNDRYLQLPHLYQHEFGLEIHKLIYLFEESQNSCCPITVS